MKVVLPGCALALLFLASPATGGPPNILADDMGWQDCSVPFGPDRTPFSERYRTPSLERLAGEGMKFDEPYPVPVR